MPATRRRKVMGLRERKGISCVLATPYHGVGYLGKQYNPSIAGNQISCAIFCDDWLFVILLFSPDKKDKKSHRTTILLWWTKKKFHHFNQYSR